VQHFVQLTTPCIFYGGAVNDDGVPVPSSIIGGAA